MAFQLIGLGYTAWATLINDHITDDKDIQKIFNLGESTHNNNFGIFMTEFFDQNLVAPPLVIARVGPSLTILLFHSYDYPAITADFKKDYFPPATNPQGALSQAATMVIVQHSSEIGKKADANGAE